MKKFLAVLLSLALIFSAISVMGISAFAEEPAPDFTVSEKYWECSDVTVYDNTMVNSAIYVTAAVGANYKNITQTSPEALSLDAKKTWLNSDGMLRFWIKTPWREGTPQLDFMVNICVASTGNPSTGAPISVAADGKWHEIRIETTSFEQTKFDLIETDANFYVRVKGNNGTATEAKEGLYFSPFEFYSTDLTSELDDGERNAFIIGNNDDTNKPAVLDSEIVNVVDNKFIRQAKKLTLNTANALDAADTTIYTYKAKITATADENGNSYNELRYCFENWESAEFRTYIKNDSDYAIKFKLGIYCSFSDSWPGLTTNDTFELKANSGWQEFRFTLKDTEYYKERINDFITKSGTISVRLKGTAGEFLKDEGDALYISTTEVHDAAIPEAVTTEFERDYKLAGAVTGDYSWGTNANFNRSSNNCDELPFFGKSITLKAIDEGYTVGTHFINAVTGKVTTDFADWAYNPDAELRFWVKSDKVRNFKIRMQASNGSSYKTITTADVISCDAADGWQEIRVKRSQFSDTNEAAFNSQVETSVNTLYISLITTEDTFAAGETFEIGMRFEFFSHQAYDKGDANRDESIDIIDLIRIKRLISLNSDDIATADINSDSVLGSDDLVLIRKNLLTNEW